MKTRLAICVSGQIRNDTKFLQSVYELFPRDTFDIDFFGHTWNDQPTPAYTDTWFKMFFKTDQAEIWNTISQKDNIFDYVPYKKQWKGMPEYVEAITTGKNLIPLYKKIISASYGQTWSHHLLVNKILQTQDFEKYDLAVKLRWDFVINPDSTLDDIVEFQNTIIKFSRKKFLHDVQNRAMCICSRDAVIRSGSFINDIVFGFRFPSQQRCILDIFRDIRKLNTKMPTSHCLWNDYWMVMGKLDKEYKGVLTSLPDIFQPNRLNESWGNIWYI